MHERLTLLSQAQVISEEAARRCNDVSVLLSQRLGLASDNEQFQMAITHLARAFDRIKANEPIDKGMDPELFEDITSDPLYCTISSLNNEIAGMLGISVPTSENTFMLSNLLSLHYAAIED
ncbi:PRD domain-containing protein [Enterovibrio nigricans]|uniref:PRD domain-containing protein n=1 Tax=Enterovibrio nigricans DSM 22720 TaxID=1121868 RepID=A0A1T4UJ33_9GAMM|nr:PRD domain-containing protein [Enterovibrio nigricans]PKF51250.1 PRD domain-containing protein [Enterovibrio nigricans]SKA52745.1 PRD domain-containing protein [Enterovibrio nigricans DSM 22720]